MMLSCIAVADVTDGLVACWSFEDEEVIGADSTHHHHDGTVYGGDVSQVRGPSGNAVYFSGDSRLEIPVTSDLNSTDEITVSYWLKSTQAVPSSGGISIVRHDGHFTGGQLRDSQNISAIGFPPTGGYFKIGTRWNGIYNNDQWHHFAAVYNDGIFQLYCDGQLAVASQQSALKSSSLNWALGGKEDGGEYYTGALDEVRVYDRALSESDISTLAASYLPLNPSPADKADSQAVSGLVLSWRASLDLSDFSEPNPDITSYYLYYRLNDADFDDADTVVVQVDADQNHDNQVDPVVSFGPLDFGLNQTIYWKVLESINGSLPEHDETIQGPVWSFQTQQTASLQTGLVGYWAFDDSSDIGADFSGYHQQGTASNSGVSFVEGIGGGAVSFDGSSVMEVASTSALNSTDEITVSYWFKSTQSVPGGSASMVRHDGHFSGGQLRDSQNISAIGFPSAGGYFKIGTVWNGVYNDDQWHHLAAVYGGGTLNMYIDGDWVAGNNSLTSEQSTLQSSGTNWSFGGREGAVGEFYVGALDEIRVYDRRLSVLEVERLAAGYLLPYRSVPLHGAEEQAASGLILSWHASLNESDLSEPNPAITGYYLYYRSGDANFDAAGTTMVQIDADPDDDEIVDAVASYGPLNFGSDQIVYWKVCESIHDSQPEDEATIQGPVWSFQTTQTQLVILEPPAEQTIDVGDDVILSVRYTSISEPACVWYTAEGRPVDAVNTISTTTLDSTTGEYTSSLTFHDILSAQEGGYYCVLTNAVRTNLSAPVRLTVRKGLLDWVDPTIGTIDSRWFYFSSACRPFGMVNLSPDTDTEGSWNSGYLYGKLNVRCFSHVHAWQLAGIPVMPTVGPFKGHLGMDHYQSTFTHEREIVQPGYHRVHLDTYGITAELTSTDRVGFHRYTFPESQDSYVIFDVGAYLAHSATKTAYIHQISDTRIEGYSVQYPTMRRPHEPYIYFSAEFSKPFEEFGVWQNGSLVTPSPDSISGANTGGYAKFTTSDNEHVLLKVAISYTSMAQARKNLEAELSDWNFDQIVQDSQDQWNEWLGRIEVEGGSNAQTTKFYTDLWHSLLGRRMVSDADGKYCDMTSGTPIVRTVPLDDADQPRYPHYNFDALWGAHWTLNVMWSMVYPELMDGFANTMISMYEDGGYIPRGPSGGNYTHVMLADPATSFFACAYNKGIRNYDAEKAYEGLRKNAFVGGLRDWASYEHTDFPTGGGMPDYVSRGYVPDNVTGSGTHNDGASMTLEYSYQDWCLGQMAKALDKYDDYRFFTERSYNYRNLWDSNAKLIHPRTGDGSFTSSFSALSTYDFCESSAVVYTNFVPHDLRGLAVLFGGNEAYTDFLDDCFESAESARFLGIGQRVDYSNQPGTQMAHLFNHSGAPWLSQKWVRKVKELTFGGTTPYNGYNGDEDQGQMGALGVLMAMGLFEMDGGCATNPTYEITSPVFDRVTIHLDNRYYPGDTFEITTVNNSSENMYIQSAQLNGQDWDRCWFPHSTYASGGTLQLVMGADPNLSWGSRPETMPPSVPFRGDLNNDGKVNFEDFSILSQGWPGGYTIYSLHDLACDWLGDYEW